MNNIEEQKGFFYGFMDGIRIYDRLLSRDEVILNMHYETDQEKCPEYCPDCEFLQYPKFKISCNMCPGNKIKN